MNADSTSFNVTFTADRFRLFSVEDVAFGVVEIGDAGVVDVEVIAPVFSLVVVVVVVVDDDDTDVDIVVDDGVLSNVLDALHIRTKR